MQKNGMEADLQHEWLKHSLVMIMTMRADDAAKWEPARLVALAQSFSLGALGFSVGGVTAFYPTALPGHPVSPSLGERDLVGDTVQALHAAGIRAIGRIDPSLGSAAELEAHPSRFARTATGEAIRLHDFYLTCPNGAHYGEFMLDVVREILQRYELDGLWANAAQFSPWGTGRCHCDNCKRLFREATGADFPDEDWSNPVWKRYNEWRYERIAHWNARVKQITAEVRPGCAWLPLSQVIESWDHTRKGGWDIDFTSQYADAVVLEAQRRYCNLWWPGMEARYAHAMDPGRGVGITVSYFYPWWRFTHAPVPENRVWVAQMIANGARPWLHLTGYFSEHFDRRGITSMQALFSLIHSHADVYGPRQSAAEVALVYSRTTLDYAGAANPDLNYLDGFRGAYNALMDGRLPFDLISDKKIKAQALARYKSVLLPNLACITDEAAEEASPGSGMSVPEFNAAGRIADVPLLLTRRIGHGSLVYFPWEPDRIGFHFGLRDPMRLITAALRAGPQPLDLVEVQARGLVDVSVMDAPDSRVVHLVNFNSAGGIRSGHRRAVEDVIELHGLTIQLRLPQGARCRDVALTVGAEHVPFAVMGDRIRFTVPVLTEFESVLVRYEQ